MDRRILVTGTGSGLGATLYERFGDVALTRADNPAEFWEHSAYDAIVHCAIDLAEGVDDPVSKNVSLLKDVCRIPHRLFVYISSVDVYPNADGALREDDPLGPIPTDASYRAIKLACEQVLADTGTASLVLRPAALLGSTARPNSLIRMRRDPHCALSLSAASTFNYVLHRQVGEFIEAAMRDGHTGVYNIAATENVTLKEVAGILGARPVYGNFQYRTGDIDNSKAKAIYPELSMTSNENITAFIQECA